MLCLCVLINEFNARRGWATCVRPVEDFSSNQPVALRPQRKGKRITCSPLTIECGPRTVPLLRGGSRGARGQGPPIFDKVNLIFDIVYNVWKNIFEIEFGFYSGRNPRSFWKCGGCTRVCVNRNRGRYCFLFSKGPILNDIRGHSDSKNICQIAGNRI